MHRHPDYTRRRLQLLANRMLERVHAERMPITQLSIHGPTDRIPHTEAEKLEYRPVKVGEQLGPQWSTWWVKAEATVPPAWDGSRVDLLWTSHSEALVWMDGHTVSGLNGRYPATEDSRPDAKLLERAKGGQSITFYVEVACNGMFGKVKTNYVSVSPFVLDRVELVRFDREAWDLYFDFMVLQSLETEVQKDLDPAWAGELLSELNRFANEYDEDDRATWAPARDILKALYQRRNATVVHELSAIGHAHIDTAWLWPIAETWRKCERTFTTQLAYMDEYPQYRFACSQAYQHWIIERRNPWLFDRMRKAAARGQFVPVGGTWVEPDCNVPSGESLVRQFLIGQRYFEATYGERCREFWNPDVFGYNGQLPQIMREAGISRFLTQKLSWNRFTKPLYHTFRWEGIDGSQVLAHFPPMDTYNASAEVADIRRNVRNYKDHDRSRDSIMLFGHGDGGGGPTRRMIEIVSRIEDLEGMPRTQIRTSDAFFMRLERDVLKLPVVVGELYFEYHRGTYTSQAATKKQNRRNEFRLHNAEWLATLAWKLQGQAYPHEALQELWQLLLVNQFHDILPGSSITLVYEDTLRDHAQVEAGANAIAERALHALRIVPAGVGGRGGDVPEGQAPYNPLDVPRAEVTTSPDGSLVWVEAPAYGVGWVVDPQETVTCREVANGVVVMENTYLRVELAADGTVRSLYDTEMEREALASPGNVFELYDDKPNDFDAWDIDPFHLETSRPCPAADTCRINSEDPLRAEVAFERRIGTASTMRQTVRLDAGSRRLEFHTEVEWHESHKLLKVAFPVTVRAMNATYEMQFGVVERPTHFNSAQDLARYEVPGHRFADLSEHGFGVSLLSDCKYGYSTHGSVMRMTLLRAPKSPDPDADMGHHAFAYALYPHPGTWQEGGVVAEGLRFNQPLLWGPEREPVSWFASDDPNLILDTVKKAEDSDAIVLRLYECHGARGTGVVHAALPFRRAVRANILEDDGEELVVSGSTIEVPYEPYRLITVKLT